MIPYTFIFKLTENSCKCFYYDTYIEYNNGIIFIEKDDLLYYLNCNLSNNLAYVYWILDIW